MYTNRAAAYKCLARVIKYEYIQTLFFPKYYVQVTDCVVFLNNYLPLLLLYYYYTIEIL